jgi:hypothetical protein
MNKTNAQEKAWKIICETVTADLPDGCSIDESTPYVLRVARLLKPIRQVILNFAGADLFVHCEEDGRPTAAPTPVRVNQDGTLLDIQADCRVTPTQINSKVRTYMAA